MHQSKHTRYLTYPTTLHERVYSVFLGPLIALTGVALFIFFIPHSYSVPERFSFGTLIGATLYTFFRLCLAYVCALITAIPLAYIATKNKTFEKILLPVFDVLESIPVLAFFPVLVLFFIHIGLPDVAALSVIFLAMLWNIVFAIVGGFKIIPKDIMYASHVFNIRGWNYVRSVLLPSIFPQIVTGSILAFAQGWNLIIVAEIIHTYIPLGTESQDLFGIGSIMANAGTHGNTTLFITCLAILVACIALLNFFVWQKLMKYSEKYSFE